MTKDKNFVLFLIFLYSYYQAAEESLGKIADAPWLVFINNELCSKIISYTRIFFIVFTHMYYFYAL